MTVEKIKEIIKYETNVREFFREDEWYVSIWVDPNNDPHPIFIRECCLGSGLNTFLDNIFAQGIDEEMKKSYNYACIKDKIVDYLTIAAFFYCNNPISENGHKEAYAYRELYKWFFSQTSRRINELEVHLVGEQADEIFIIYQGELEEKNEKRRKKKKIRKLGGTK